MKHGLLKWLQRLPCKCWNLDLNPSRVSRVRRGGREVDHRVGRRTGIQGADIKKSAYVGGFGKVLPYIGSPYNLLPKLGHLRVKRAPIKIIGTVGKVECLGRTRRSGHPNYKRDYWRP